MELQETIRVTLNTILGVLGFLATLGWIFSTPMGLIVMMVHYFDMENPNRERNIKYGFILFAWPISLIFITLVSFAIVNTVLQGSY